MQFGVLLVDDEEELVKALAERLEIRGLSTEIALDGEQALQVIQKREPDVMVLDLKMPGMDGLEVLRQVKKTHPGIQVVIMTGHGSEKDRDAAERLGAFGYLQKPVGIDLLLETLKLANQRRIEEA